MKKLRRKTIHCSICRRDFLGKKQEKDSRCKNCRTDYLKKWRNLPKTVKRKAELHRKLREQAFSGYGGKCQCCGEKRFEFLVIDHVNGNGNKERKRISTHQIARKIINSNFPPEYRVLCHNCNMSLGFFGYCPHKK